ncbi:peptide chain release factor N(5)-glutamine methyltransferase [Amphibacillus cookii]|uniref:peptide chain release factor N(5)-glutamine methyltransferase n=1 Tax=Amphibacillus cookii TaxID=767787 RepID=UPI00195BE59D|nr:peptide chain release factor N(5)-glutamine methyltransferase [Amphibacillus cookii]MBM7540831.1 release factor glutamine methyltransferase [Amphibacillus cookii]
MNLTIQEVLNRAFLFLQHHHREPKVAEILLLHHLQYSKAQLLMELRTSVPQAIYQAFQADLQQHVDTGIPVQHLTGVEQFYGRTFTVNQHVLIPRPETEELVQYVLGEVKQRSQPLRVLDVGTGSGVIAITLKLELPSLAVEAGDISADALAVARLNAEALKADITFRESDFLSEWLNQGEQFDLIVSNPPYISWSQQDDLMDTVKDFDPELALFADQDGLAAYQQIISNAPRLLAKQGCLAFEIGDLQGKQVQALIKNTFPKSDVAIIKDLNGKDRIVFAKKRV